MRPVDWPREQQPRRRARANQPARGQALPRADQRRSTSFAGQSDPDRSGALPEIPRHRAEIQGPPMSAKAMRILLIGHDPSEGRAVREALANVRDSSFIVECAPLLVDGLKRLSGNGIAAILLDLSLPDSQGIATFEQVYLMAPHVPILVIGSPDDEDVAMQAVERGAQDSLQRDHLDSYTLPRALKRIIERKAAEEALYFEQQRAEVTLNSIGDAVLSIDMPGNVTYLNLVAERMTGWLRQDALGRPLAEVLQIIDATTRLPARNPLDQAMQLDKIVGLTSNCV